MYVCVRLFFVCVRLFFALGFFVRRRYLGRRSDPIAAIKVRSRGQVRFVVDRSLRSPHVGRPAHVTAATTTSSPRPSG
jgi:hypothetical protein